jgi:hypothetical protein
MLSRSYENIPRSYDLRSPKHRNKDNDSVRNKELDENNKKLPKMAKAVTFREGPDSIEQNKNRSKTYKLPSEPLVFDILDTPQSYRLDRAHNYHQSQQHYSSSSVYGGVRLFTDDYDENVLDDNSTRSAFRSSYDSKVASGATSPRLMVETSSVPEQTMTTSPLSSTPELPKSYSYTMRLTHNDWNVITSKRVAENDTTNERNQYSRKAPWVAPKGRSHSEANPRCSCLQYLYHGACEPHGEALKTYYAPKCSSDDLECGYCVRIFRGLAARRQHKKMSLEMADNKNIVYMPQTYTRVQG